MKAIILAGGSGTRLYPTTMVVNKHLLPIYNKPMIYYPLSLVMLVGIRDILLVVNPYDESFFYNLLGDGSGFGVNISYVKQSEPRGLADGIVLGESFLGGDTLFYLLGDNIFFGHDIAVIMRNGMDEVVNNGGAVVFGYYVKDPERFGIVEFDDSGRVISIEEKPSKPKSNYAVVGAYFYDNDVVSIAKSIKPSDRGELEITSVNEVYLREGRLSVRLLGRGFAWFDAGTYDSFLEAGEFIATIEKKVGLMIGCLEEIAYKNGWIDDNILLKRIDVLKNTEYGEYLKNVVLRGK